MYARIINAPLQPGAADEATTYFRESIGPALKEQTGFLNSRFLVNSTTNECLMVTLWKTEQDRQESENNGYLSTALEGIKPHLAGPPVITYYEVAVQVI